MLGCHYLQTPVSPVCRRQSACQRTAWPLPTVWFYAVSDRSALAHTRNCYDAVLFAADLSPELCCEFENYRVARKKMDHAVCEHLRKLCGDEIQQWRHSCTV